MNIKEYVKKYNLELSEQEIQKIEKVIRQFETDVKLKGDILPTLGFGIPNLLKFGEVGYFPEQFLVDVGLQGKTALEIEQFFMSTGMDVDGDVIYRRYDNTNYFVDLKHNVFIKYYPEVPYEY